MRATGNSAPLIALASAALFGVSTPLAKILVGDINPWLLAGLLYLGSGIGLTFWYTIRRVTSGASGEAAVSRNDLPWLAGAVLFGGILGPCCFSTAWRRAMRRRRRCCSISSPWPPSALRGLCFSNTWIAGCWRERPPLSPELSSSRGKALGVPPAGACRSSCWHASLGASTTISPARFLPLIRWCSRR